MNADSLPWLLEASSPGVRYLALRDLAGAAPASTELRAARKAAHQQGPIGEVLANMQPEGYWERPGPGYNPKYRSAVWALVLLAQLGADRATDKRIATACDYALEHALTPGGQFTASGAPSGTADCLQGNLCWALLELGVDPARLAEAFDWMARTVTGEGLAPVAARGAERRYYAGKCGPLFACGSNNKLPCAWGGVKVMLAFSRLPAAQRTPLIRRAIKQGAEWLLAGDPAKAGYPNGWAADAHGAASKPHATPGKPNRAWWKFGFPVFYVTDLVQNVEALARLGHGRDPRLAPALELIRQQADAQGRWCLNYHYAGKTWVDFGPARQPNKWVTLRAARALNLARA